MHKIKIIHHRKTNKWHRFFNLGCFLSIGVIALSGCTPLSAARTGTEDTLLYFTQNQKEILSQRDAFPPGFADMREENFSHTGAHVFQTTLPSLETDSGQANYSQNREAASQARVGGVFVVVEPHETTASLARRYGVSEQALRKANSLEQGKTLSVGQKILIPAIRNHTRTLEWAQKGEGGRASEGKHKEELPPPPLLRPRVSSKHSEEALHTPERMESSLFLTSAVPIPPQRSKKKNTPSAADVGGAQSSASSPAESLSNSSPLSAEESEGMKELSAQDSSSIASIENSPSFRWPVRGRIISEFGNKQGGQRNDGINLSLPVGTQICAAEDGLVIYAGNELQGYGNLLLLRHEGGWVSAYAHNSKLLVQRGERVRRGDVIAQSGVTGAVTRPQLHFELRYQNRPVDPLKYLSKG